MSINVQVLHLYLMKPQLWRGAERRVKPLAQSSYMYDGHVRTISLSEVARLSKGRFPPFRPTAQKAVSGPKPLFRLQTATEPALQILMTLHLHT